MSFYWKGIEHSKMVKGKEKASAIYDIYTVCIILHKYHMEPDSHEWQPGVQPHRVV